MRFAVPLLPLEIAINRRPTTGVKVRIRDLMILTLLVAMGIYWWQNDDRRLLYRSRFSFHQGEERRTDWLRQSTAQSASQFIRQAEELEKVATEAERSGDDVRAARARREESDLRTIAANQKLLIAPMIRRAQHHKTLAAKYLSASDRPWLPILPDPEAP